MVYIELLCVSGVFIFGQMVNIGTVMCKWCFIFGQMVNIGAVMCK